MCSSEFFKIFKNIVFTEHLWTSASVIRTVECGILVIKKTSEKTLQIRIYSVFLNLPTRHVQKKKRKKKRNLIVKEKGHSFISISLQWQHWKIKIWFFMSALFLEFMSILVKGMYFSFLLFVNTRLDLELIREKH